MMKNTRAPAFVGIGLAVLLLSQVSFAAPRVKPARTLPTAKKTPTMESTPSQPSPEASAPYSEPIESDIAAQPYESVSTPRKMNPWWIFLGADAGLASFGAANTGTEASRSGIDLGVRALLARYFSKWVIDGGLGWFYMQNSATYPNGDNVKVTTRSGYIDLSGRYRFPRSNWQLGPELEYWLSTDNGSNTSVFDNTSNHNAFIGLQGIYETPTDNGNRIRFGGRWLTDLNVSGRSANIFQVFFQYGFSVFGAKHEAPPKKYEQMNESDLEKASAYTPPVDPLPIATPEPTPEATPWQEPLPISTPEPTPVPTATPKPIAKEKLVMTLDVNDLPFEFDSARMPKYNMDRVREIGRFLGEHKNTWKTLTVSGHTDERGANSYNDKLSKARADTVRQLLGEGGAPIGRIKAVGYGERKPKVKGHTEAAWAKNRRVELEFHGVKDVQIIKGAFGGAEKGEESQ